MTTQMNRSADGRNLILFDLTLSVARVDELSRHHAATADTDGRFEWVQGDGIHYITDKPLSDDDIQAILATLHIVLEIGMIIVYDADGSRKIFSVYAKPHSDADLADETMVYDENGCSYHV